MSLINDALKRAKQVQQTQGPTAEPIAKDALKPVVRTKTSSTSIIIPIVLVVALGFAGWAFWQAWQRHQAEPKTVVAAAPQKPEVNKQAIENAPSTTPSLTNQAEVPKHRYAAAIDTAKKNFGSVQAINTSIDETGATPVQQVQPGNPKPASQNPAKNETPTTHEPAKTTAEPDSEVQGIIRASEAGGNEAKLPEYVVNTPTGFPKIKLQGIFYKSDKASALMNGSTLFQGDSINGVKILKIDPESVIMEYNGRKIILGFKR
jgi:hypothetical protein